MLRDPILKSKLNHPTPYGRGRTGRVERGKTAGCKAQDSQGGQELNITLNQLFKILVEAFQPGVDKGLLLEKWI